MICEIGLPEGIGRDDLRLTVSSADGRTLVAIGPVPERDDEPTESASEPPPPSEITSVDELYVTGLHLEQYRHATRSPHIYWREALERDPLDSRCNNAMGLWHFRRGELDLAEQSFRRALKRLRRRNPNPYDGEAFYNLGVTLMMQGRHDAAYAALSKAAWNVAWIAPSHLALAEIDASRGNWNEALEHAEEALRYGTENLRARDLKAFCLRHLDREAEAEALFEATLALDPLDHLAGDALGKPLGSDPQVILDLSLDYARMGNFRRAFELVSDREAPEKSGAAPLYHYYAAYFADRLGLHEAAAEHRDRARRADSDYCFPSRIEEILILRAAMDANPKDSRAPYYLGNLFYDKRRHREAMALWERSSDLAPGFPVVWRNLGISRYNIGRDADGAMAAYDNAFMWGPNDARIFYERDQLWKRTGVEPGKRLAELEDRLDLVARRDDLTIELAALYNQTGSPEKALATLLGRNFQPWEGGEGLALEQYARCRLKLGHLALRSGDAATARREFEAALNPPRSLGEARHLLANQSDLHYWAGVACAAAGDRQAAIAYWQAAADFRGDFLGMELRSFSDKTRYSILSMNEIGREEESASVLEALEAYAQTLMKDKAKIDYFATSLPTMLIFEEDIQKRQEISAYIMLAQVCMARGERAEAKKWLLRVRQIDPNHDTAADLLAELDDSN